MAAVTSTGGCLGGLTFFAPRRHPGPVAEEALRRVVALEHVAVPALELAHHAVVESRSHHHAVLRGLRKLGAFCCHRRKTCVSRADRS